jgi:hypothetical protein
LGLTLYGVVFTMMVLTTNSSSPFDGSSAGDIGTSIVRNASTLALVFGAAYLVIAAVLDRAGRRGLATQFVAVGIVAAVTGAFGVATDISDLGGIMLLAAVSATVFFVGAVGDRRASTWLGAIGMSLAGIALVAQIVGEDQDGNPNGPTFGLLLIVVAAAMAGAAHWFARRDHAPVAVLPPTVLPAAVAVSHLEPQPGRPGAPTGVANCPQCGEPPRAGAVFCAGCGAVLP